MGHKPIEGMSVEEEEGKQQTAKRSMPPDSEAASIREEKHRSQYFSQLQETVCMIHSML